MGRKGGGRVREGGEKGDKDKGRLEGLSVYMLYILLILFYLSYRRIHVDSLLDGSFFSF